jgi:hypothetical protein
MNIQCECGKFSAQLQAFPNNTPGRLVCYCDDCQSYLHHIGRADLLDSNGGTEVIPAYPADVKILSGKEHVKCVRLSSKGMFRFYASCCNTPIGNTRANDPWIGLHRRIYTSHNGDKLDQTFKSIHARIMGRFAKGTPPEGTPATFNLKAFTSVMPFILKGKFKKLYKNSPFFKEDGLTSIVQEHVLSSDELKAARSAAGFKNQ